MRWIKRITVFLFALTVLLPVLFFCWEPEVASEIDNRMLAGNPFSPEIRAVGNDLTQDIENFVNDRIGLRDEMILGYTLLNDKLFGKMVHPSYCYGKEGFVFQRITALLEYGSYHKAFAGMIKKIQDYCEERNVPFVFAFEPSKTTILQEYLPVGVRYDNSWVDRFLGELDVLGVRYVDNRAILQEKTDAGEQVFNRQYDAGHWNDLGAFYGVNAILAELQKDFPGIHVNTMDEITVSEELQTSLLVSQFPIHEMTPVFTFPTLEYENLSESYYDEVRRNRAHRGFAHTVNRLREAEGAPRTLVFQGSYMNGKGWKFLQNGLGEYIYIHNYQNVMDFDYYFNIFQPECVIFEVTEYAMTPGYFDLERIEAVSLNPCLSSVQTNASESETLPLSGVSIQQGEALTVLFWSGGDGAGDFAWAVLGGTTFDLRRSEAGGWEVTVKNEVWDQYGDDLQITVLAGEVLREYQ